MKKIEVSSRSAFRELVDIRGLDHGGLDIQLDEIVLDELTRAPIAVTRDHQMPALGQECEEERRGSTHSAREEHGLFGAV